MFQKTKCNAKCIKQIIHNKLSLFILLLLLSSNIGIAQKIGKYKKIDKIKHDKFNYPLKVRTEFDWSVKMVFSDREDNQFYRSPYIQEKAKKKGLLVPMYVIDEKENAYKVVVANPDQIGKPKGLFSIFYGDKYNFKDTEQVEYLGWVPKTHVVNYNHSYLEPKNNKPLKYKLGTSNVKRLFDLEPYMEVDSIEIFKDPFLKIKSGKKLLSNQIVYPYKYDLTEKAVFIADKPVLKDSISQIAGWVRSDLITPIGQSQVYVLKDNDNLKTYTKNDTLKLIGENVYPKYLYTGRRNLKENVKDSLVAPIYVWNHIENKMINVKGNSFYTKEIKFIKKESKVVNIHFISKTDDSTQLRRILNSLQSLYLSLFKEATDIKYNFSAILINRYGAEIYHKSDSFAQWIDFIETYVDKTEFNSYVDYTHSRMNIPQAITHCIDNFLQPQKRFENNLFIVASSKEYNNIVSQQEPYFFKKIAEKSSKLLFVQLENDESEDSQNFILGSKEFLYKTGKSYNDFIKTYIVDNKIVVGDNLFKSIESENDNVYVLDAPDNSLFNGGVVFPKIKNSLTPLSLEKAIDTILQRSHLTTKKIVNSLNYYNKKLGVLRSKPTALIKQKYYDLETDSLRLFQISRNNLHEVLYQRVSVANDSILQKGYILDKEEIVNLIDYYRNTFPQMAKPITRKKRRVMKRLYQKQMQTINVAAHRYVLNRKTTFADLFYFKSGIPLNHKGYYCLRINKLPRKKVEKWGFEEFYFKQYDKINKFEELFLKNKFEKVESGYFKEVYFIPIELLP